MLYAVQVKSLTVYYAHASNQSDFRDFYNRAHDGTLQMEFYIRHGEYKILKSERLSGEVVMEKIVRTDGCPGPDSSKLIIATALLSLQDHVRKLINLNLKLKYDNAHQPREREDYI